MQSKNRFKSKKSLSKKSILIICASLLGVTAISTVAASLSLISKSSRTNLNNAISSDELIAGNGRRFKESEDNPNLNQYVFPRNNQSNPIGGDSLDGENNGFGSLDNDGIVSIPINKTNHIGGFISPTSPSNNSSSNSQSPTTSISSQSLNSITSQTGAIQASPLQTSPIVMGNEDRSSSSSSLTLSTSIPGGLLGISAIGLLSFFAYNTHKLAIKNKNANSAVDGIVENFSIKENQDRANKLLRKDGDLNLVQITSSLDGKNKGPKKSVFWLPTSLISSSSSSGNKIVNTRFNSFISYLKNNPTEFQNPNAGINFLSQSSSDLNSNINEDIQNFKDSISFKSPTNNQHKNLDILAALANGSEASKKLLAPNKGHDLPEKVVKNLNNKNISNPFDAVALKMTSKSSDPSELLKFSLSNVTFVDEKGQLKVAPFYLPVDSFSKENYYETTNALSKIVRTNPNDPTAFARSVLTSVSKDPRFNKNVSQDLNLNVQNVVAEIEVTNNDDIKSLKSNHSGDSDFSARFSSSEASLKLKKDLENSFTPNSKFKNPAVSWDDLSINSFVSTSSNSSETKEKNNKLSFDGLKKRLDNPIKSGLINAFLISKTQLNDLKSGLLSSLNSKRFRKIVSNGFSKIKNKFTNNNSYNLTKSKNKNKYPVLKSYKKI